MDSWLGSRFRPRTYMSFVFRNATLVWLTLLSVALSGAAPLVVAASCCCLPSEGSGSCCAGSEATSCCSPAAQEVTSSCCPSTAPAGKSCCQGDFTGKLACGCPSCGCSAADTSTALAQRVAENLRFDVTPADLPAPLATLEEFSSTRIVNRPCVASPSRPIRELYCVWVI